MNLFNLLEIRIASEIKGYISKKENRILELLVIGDDGRQYVAKIDVNDRYADEIIKNIQTLKQLESDNTYWVHQSITFKTNLGQKTTIDIYPLTPFLADTEEIIWLNTKTDANSQPKGRVTGIDVVTDYRIFQYDYRNHYGRTILLPALEDIIIDNEKQTWKRHSIGSFSRTLQYGKLVKANRIGDIIFIYDQKSYIKFEQITDPQTLASAVWSIKKALINMLVEIVTHPPSVISQPEQKIEPPNIEPPPSVISQPEQKIEPPKSTQGKKTHITESVLSCTTCNGINPPESKFCNKCGSPLSSPFCQSCGNKNPTSAVFCNQCGSRLNAGQNNSDPKLNKYEIHDNITRENFLEYISIEHRIKLKYPVSWTERIRPK